MKIKKVIPFFIKILGNTIKIFSYLFHFIFPNKRFLIPNTSDAWIKPKNHSLIPRIIWQTNFTSQVTLPVYLNYLCNRILSPTYQYRFMNTEQRSDFIKENYSAEIFKSYSKLQLGACQADFWRVLVLNVYGGVYMDIDACLKYPMKWIITSEFEELYIKNRKNMFTNYFLASKNKNQNLENIMHAIMKNIEENKIKNVYDLTGPHLVNSVLSKSSNPSFLSHSSVCFQGIFTNKHFQYIDKKDGIWTELQKKIPLVREHL